MASLPLQANWNDLSRRALLRQLDRGDAAHALLMLQHEARTADRFLFVAWGRSETLTWAGEPGRDDGAAWWLPLVYLGERVGVLCLGSKQRHHFVGDTYPRIRVLARALAMELGDWMHRQIRADLMANARITEDDLLLLRHQQQGHNSKVIATALNTEAKTIDCRFHRLSLARLAACG